MPTRRSVLPNVLLKRAPKPTAQRARSGINSGLDLLECLAAQERPLTLTEIALAVGMAKSSVHQLLLSLVARGYAQRLPDQRYSIGIKAWEIGCRATFVEIGRVAEPHMAALVRKVSEGAALAVLDGRHTVCIQIAESRQAVRVHRRVGERNPAHVVSNGLALLSTLGDDEIVALLPEKLEQPTARTLGTRDEVLAELRRVRQRGFAVCRGSWQLDVAGVAVPVRGADHRAAAAVAIALPLDRLTAARLQEFAAALGEAASAIERQLGGPALTLPGLAPTPRLERRA
jgi:DNA-binding IclR family transcriptional regulator